MTTLLTTLRVFDPRRLFRPRWLLVAGILLGGLLALRMLKPAAPAQLMAGQALAWDIARGESQSPGVQLVSGAYLPGDRMLLYTRTTQTDRARVRAWAQMQIEPFADRLAKMPSSEQLAWIIDFGPAPAEQEVLIAPLNQAADPSLYRYVGAAPDLVAETGTAPIAATLPVQPTAVSAQPTAASIQPSAAPVQSAVQVPQPTTAPTLAATGQPLLTTGFDEAGEGASAWLPLSGDWLAHDGIYSQRDNTGYDLISLLDLAPQSHYQMDARLRLGDGDMGGGFIYNAPDKTTRAGAQTVDFDNKGGFLRWGRYDANGAYTYEGGAKIDPPINDGQWHTLQLVTHAAASVVSLDGREVGTITNTSTSGYFGLTSSKTKVDFDNVAVTVLPEAGVAPATQPTTQTVAATSFNDDFADGDAKGWQVLSGTWQVIDGTYQQTNTSGFDLGSISPFQSDHFSATVRLKSLGGDMGAGMYFNLDQRDKKSRSQMINYTQGGKMLQWGHFDEGGNFVFEGSAPVPNGSDGAWHILTVRVSAGKATFTLDGQEVARDVSLTYASGYVGLLASTSKVAFDDVQFVAQ